MNDFAKIFYHPDFGQIVVIADEDSNGNPTIIYHVRHEGLMYKLTIGFSGKDAYEKFDRAFEKVDAESTLKLVPRIFDQI